MGLHVVEGGPIKVDGKSIETFGAAMITDEPAFTASAENDSELLLVDVALS